MNLPQVLEQEATDYNEAWGLVGSGFSRIYRLLLSITTLLFSYFSWVMLTMALCKSPTKLRHGKGEVSQGTRHGGWMAYLTPFAFWSVWEPENSLTKSPQTKAPSLYTTFQDKWSICFQASTGANHAILEALGTVQSPIIMTTVSMGKFKSPIFLCQNLSTFSIIESGTFQLQVQSGGQELWKKGWYRMLCLFSNAAVMNTPNVVP